jgi:transcriptional regulator with PAS, ATPase and Fis domain
MGCLGRLLGRLLFGHLRRSFTTAVLTDVLDEAHLDKKKAADLLGISLASLYRKLSASPGDSSPPSREE